MDSGLQECQIFTPSGPLERGGKDAHAWEVSIFLLGGQVFYRTSVVLFTGDGEGEKIKVGLLEKTRAHAYPHI